MLLGVEPARAEAANHGSTLAELRARGELRWGADAQGGAPYVFQDPMDPNHLIGFEVELAAALAKKLGVRARPVQGQWDQLLELLARGDFDVALNGIEVAEEKRRVCELTRAYYVAAERLTVRRADDRAPRSLEALRGRPAGTLPGSLAERILIRAGAEVKTYDGGQNEIYDDLRIGRTAAVLLDEPIARYYGAIEPSLEVLDGAFGEVRYAIAVRKGDVELSRALDAALDELSRDGTLRKLYERWGLWNAETARLLGDPRETTNTVPEAWEAWRSRRRKEAAFSGKGARSLPEHARLVRARRRAHAAALARGDERGGRARAFVIALARSYGARPLRWLALGYVEILPRHAATRAADDGVLRFARAGRDARSVRGRSDRARTELRGGRGRELPRRSRQRLRGPD